MSDGNDTPTSSAIDDLPLWDHQVEAVETFKDYLASEAVARSALVSMPTGTGKSAVIGSLVTSEGDPDMDVLVLTPWAGLAKQLREDLDSRIWAILGVPRPEALGTLRSIPSAKRFIEALGDRGAGRRIWVGTIAMMLEVWKNVGRDGEAMRALFQRVAFTVVDECHYEPSELWSQSVRATGLKTCLLTATAFRNDNRFFDVDPAHTYRFRHADAEARGILRRPEFHHLDHSEPDEASFVRTLLPRLADVGIGADDRIVIRCGDGDSIRAIVNLLHDAGETAVGFHDGFAKSPAEHLFEKVPAPRDRPNARFWVHQNKLTEGLDDPRFRAVVLHHGFGNDRSTIQQIGRVLRNTDHRRNAPAIVLSAKSGSVQAAWSRYLAFDQALLPRSVATFPSLVEDLIKSQPETIYWGSLFRTKLDLGSPDAWKQFKYVRNVRAWLVPPDRRPAEHLDRLAEEIAVEWTQANRRTYGPLTPPGAPSARVIPYVALRNSPVLRDTAFVETRIGYTVVVWLAGHLFLTDSEGATPDVITSDFFPLTAEALHRIMPTEARITAVSLTNSDTNPHALRARSARARDLASIASEIGESTYACATAQGYLTERDKTFARYIGTKNARIRDHGGAGGDTFPDYYAWIKKIAGSLTSEATTAAALARYALPTNPPGDTTPVHALIDADPTAFDAPEGTVPLQIEQTGGPVDDDGCFLVTVNGDEHQASIRWDADRSRYLVESDSLAALPYRSAQDGRRGLLYTVNADQSLRVATPNGVAYTNGNFWDLTTRRSSTDGIFTVLRPVQSLDGAKSEKGTAEPTTGWPTDSVFGIVDKILVPGDFGTDSLLLCTDLGAEIADFIACNDERVAFIHAKANRDGSTLSAAAFHDVASQAIKNLRYLTLGNTDTPKSDYWTEDWSLKGHGSTSRHRQGTKHPTGDAYWEHINSRIQSHGIEREVWVVAGASLSKTALESAMGGTPQPNAAQAYVLLTSLWSAAQQCGVRLKVYCSP